MTVKPAPLTVEQAREQLDAHVREVVAWHFNPETGTPFWLDRVKTLGFDPLKEVKGFDDLKKFGLFEDEWLRGGPVRRWVPLALQKEPIFVFETGGTTGIPKSRIGSMDFRIDYEMFSATLPDERFPPGANWLMLGPSGPRRLRLAVEHLAQHRGGICFCVDLDPRWVVKLLKDRRIEEVNRYKDHVIDQALTVLSAGHDIQCMFTTPKLLDSLADALARGKLEDMVRKNGGKVPPGGLRSLKAVGIKGIFGGGTEFDPQFMRYAYEEILDNGEVFMTPTYGNTLMGLACSSPVGPESDFKITYYAPQPRAVVQVVDPDDPYKVVEYGKTGRVMLTTLTKEFFMPCFLERDEGEREPPYSKYPWDGVSGVRPFSRIASQTTVGVY